MSYICFDKAAYDQVNWSAMFHDLMLEEPEGCASLISRIRNYSPEKLEALTSLWYEGKPMAIAVVAKEVLARRNIIPLQSYQDSVFDRCSSKWNKSTYTRVNWHALAQNLFFKDPTSYRRIKKQLRSYSDIELEGFTTIWHNGQPTAVAVVAWDILTQPAPTKGNRSEYDAFYQRLAQSNSHMQTWQEPSYPDQEDDMPNKSVYWQNHATRKTPSYARIISQETGCWDMDWMD